MEIGEENPQKNNETGHQSMPERNLGEKTLSNPCKMASISTQTHNK